MTSNNVKRHGEIQYQLAHLEEALRKQGDVEKADWAKEINVDVERLVVN